MSVLTLYEKYEGSINSYADVYGSVLESQSFTPSIAHSLTELDIYVFITGSPGADCVAELYLSNSGGNDDKPTGAVLATSDVFDGDSIVGTDWISNSIGRITFPTPHALDPAVKYVVVLKAPSGDASNKISWAQHTADDGYTDGKRGFSNDDGSNWFPQNTHDHRFREYGLYDPTSVTPVDITYSKKLVAIANDEVWYESSAGTMAEVAAANGDIDCGELLNMFEAYGKAFIVNDTNLKILDLINVKLHTTDIIPAAETYPRHGTVITGGTSGAKMVVDYITALNGDTTVYGQRITTATFVSGDVCTATIDEGAVSFTLDANEVAGPHWYDWTVYGQSTTFGALPNRATIGCLYRGRPTISGNAEQPHQWYMMRQANPFDALYGLNDAQSAVAGNDADAGEIGDIVRALIPYKDDYLVMGCVNTMWYVAGDPAEGGSINELDLTTGIFGAQSWCIDGEGNLWFWGTNGIYKSTIPGKPVCMSQIRLPKLVKSEAVDPSTHRITLSYDRGRACILVTITTLADGTNSNYFYDLRTEGFFPESYPEECSVFSTHYYEAVDPDFRKLVIGTYEGYLDFFDDDAEDDDIGASDEAIDSYVTFAPLPMSQDPKFTGILTGFDIILAGGASGGSQSDSNEVYFEVYVADAAEQVIEKLNAGTNPDISGTIEAPGRRRSDIKQKVKGVYMGIKAGNNTATETWAFEQLLYDLKKSGRFK